VPEPRVVDDRPLGSAELREAAALAVRAFGEDPFFRFVMPDQNMRQRGLYLVHRSVMAHAGPGAHLRTVRTANDRIVGVALWLPTGRYPQSLLTQLSQVSGTLRAFIRRPETMRRGYAYVKAAVISHPKDPHWYLQLLMTEPAEQRHGVGTALMNEALPHVDAEGVGSSLETQNADNIAYYARFGYGLRTTLQPLAEGPALYSLWRPARS
jgi:GNAT superfamily N-acetyltransferase